MNDLKLNIYRYFPQLAAKEIEALITEYMSAIIGWDGENKELTRLEKILPEVATNTFLNFAFSRGLRIDFERSAPEIQKNQRIVDFYIKKDPKVAFYVPEEMLTTEHVKIVEKYAVENKDTIRANGTIPKILRTDIIFDVVFESIKRLDYQYEKEVNLINLLESVYENDVYSDRILQYINEIYPHSNKFIAVMRFDRSIFMKMLLNDKFLKYFLEKDFSLIELVPESQIEKSYKIIAEAIRKNKSVNINSFSLDKILVLFKSKEVLDAIFELDNIILYINLFTYIDINLFDKEQLKRLYNQCKEYGWLYMPKNYENSPIALSIFLEDGNKNYFNAFTKEAYDENNVNYIFANYRDMLHLFSKGFDNNLFVKKVLLECINNPSKINLLRKIYKENVFDEENIELLIKLCNILNEKEMLSFTYFPQFVFSYSKFLKHFLDSNFDFDYSCFTSAAFDSENIKSYYQMVDYDTFFRNYSIRSDLNKTWDALKSLKVENFDDIFYKLYDNYDMTYAMIIIKKYKESGIDEDKYNTIIQYYIYKIKNDLYIKYNDKNSVDLLIDRILSGERNPFTLSYIRDESTLFVAANYLDILSDIEVLSVHNEWKQLYSKINKKHLNEIITLLKKYVQHNELFELAMKMYFSIGYIRCRDLLNPNPDKNYGNVNGDKLVNMFSKVSLKDVLLIEQGKNLMPQENSVLINLVFGANYKDKNSIIHHYLTNFSDKEKELNKEKLNIQSNNDYTNEEKTRLKAELDEEFKTFCKQVYDFIENFGVIFNKWDIIQEEFYKLQNKSKLNVKLNMSTINSIVSSIKEKNNMPQLEVIDEPLINSEVFSYVGYDNQYVSNVSTVKTRAVTLSRRMDNVSKKKFPNIQIEQDGYTLFVYNPADRNILSAGIRSNCCFRPNGTADDKGADYSLLNYCVSTEYGGGVEVRDKDGKTVMFSPILRNGNVLMIHSFESSNHNSLDARVASRLLVKFAELAIEKSKEVGDTIQFVTMTDLHNPGVTHKGIIPHDKKFEICNFNGKFNWMYTNLDRTHLLLASEEGMTFDDIQYGEVEYSYEYPRNSYYFTAQFTSAEREKIASLIQLNNKIIKLANNRFEVLEKNDEVLGNKILGEIKEQKAKYLTEYKKLLNSKKGFDLFEQYKKAISVIEHVNGKEINNLEIEEVTFGLDWYIVITPQGRIVANAVASGREELKKRLNEIKTMRPILIDSLELIEEIEDVHSL